MAAHGPPVCAALMRRSLVSATWTTELVGGNKYAAGIAFADPLPTVPKFQCVEPGWFYCIWWGRTNREAMAVSIISPESATLAKNENEWLPIEFDQLMTTDIALTRDGSNNITDADITHTEQLRHWMPFDSVAHPVLLEMEIDDEFELAIDPVDEREWYLLIIRLGKYNMAITE